MIFLTVGTHEPFDRLVRGVDAWAEATGRGGEIFGQITARAGYLPRNFDWTDNLEPAEFRDRMRASSHVVSHAGMGTIILAMTLKKPIAVMPRRGHLKETRNDHQFATVGEIGSRPGILVARTDDELPATLDRLVASGGVETAELRPYAEDALIEALRNMIHG